MDLDIRLVRYFVAVADELHFGRAAAKLYISQPALSKQIRKLESDVGTQLLVRDSRHVALTVRGEHFLDDARQLLALAERMRHPPETNACASPTSSSSRPADRSPTPSPASTERAAGRELHGQRPPAGRAPVRAARRGRHARHPADAGRSAGRVAAPADPPRAVAAGRQARRPARRVGLPARTTGRGVRRRQGSGMFNVHGEYLAAFERQTRVALRWLGNPGTFGHCLAAVKRARESAFTLEFESYAQRYAEAGIPIHRPPELQPVYPWWVAWREDRPSESTAPSSRLPWRSRSDAAGSGPAPSDGRRSGYRPTTLRCWSSCRADLISAGRTGRGP